MLSLVISRGVVTKNIYCLGRQVLMEEPRHNRGGVNIEGLALIKTETTLHFAHPNFSATGRAIQMAVFRLG